MKKQTFLQGAAVLTIATIVVKLIGALYKIPLGRVIGDQGYTYFLAAYNIYNILLTISTAGFPVAMSRMIAQAQTLGNPAQIKRIYRASLYIFLVLGVLGTAFVMIFAKPLAVFMECPNAWISNMVLAPSILFVCLFSSYRGFFQGQSNMTPTGVSQVIEALSKLVIGLGAAWLLVRRGYSIAVAAGGAVLGVTAGTVLAALYLSVKHRRAMDELNRMPSPAPSASMGQTMKTLLAIAIPITIGAAGLQVINAFDQKVVLGRLIEAGHYSQDAAEALYGIYGKATTIFNLPSALITPLTIAIIPSITEHLTLGNHRGSRTVAESAVRIMSLLALPCAVGMIVLGRPIMGLLYNYTGPTLETGGALLSWLGVSVLFNCLVLLTNAILQANGRVNIPVYTMIAGGIIKLIVNYILVAQPGLNILGAPISSIFCFGSITIMNVIAMRKVIPDRIRVLRVMGKSFLAAAAMGVATWIVYDLVSAGLHSSNLGCLAAMCAAVVVYAVFVYVLRCVTWEDCMLLPKGEAIAKLLKVSPPNEI